MMYAYTRYTIAKATGEVFHVETKHFADVALAKVMQGQCDRLAFLELVNRWNCQSMVGMASPLASVYYVFIGEYHL